MCFVRSAQCHATIGLLLWLAVACAHPKPEPAPRGIAAQTPLAWPLHGRISSGYGNQRATHRHKGIDIRTESGAPIRSAASGLVRVSGHMAGYGRVVILDHGAGLETRYAHNRRNLVRVGERVERGQWIAEVGASGNATAPHVHFEVRVDGEVQDPLAFLPSSPPPARQSR